MDKDIITYGDNYFEEVIDKMILDGIPGMNQAFVDIISNLPRDEKRMTILNLLDKDQNLFNQIKALTDRKINKMEHIKDIVVMLRKYVKDADVQKKKFGEVMTPIELVKEMLSKLPDDVWSNPNLKWLDPANGTGPFPSIVIYKLMKGLESWEQDEEKRYRHIVENMIYVVEIQPKNMFLYMCAFDPFDTYKLNIYTGSFLEKAFDFHMKNVWNVEKFDIIIGNPPYNSGSNNRGSAHVLWDKFVFKSLEEILKKDGYLSMVHPTGWRNVDGGFTNIKTLMKSREILYLNMNSFDVGRKVFGVQTDFDFYCIKNTLNTNIETEIVGIDKKTEFFDLKKIDFIPNCRISKVYDLVAKDGETSVKLISDSSYHHQKDYISASKDVVYKYPCIYTVKKGGIPTFKYSSLNNKGHFGIPKVIFSNGSAVSPIIDYGEYGLTQFSYAIVDDVENLNKIKTALENEVFVKEIMGFVGLGDKYNRKIISKLRKDFWKEFL
jgi:hypothetical protein